jgi:hypothetical protein
MLSNYSYGKMKRVHNEPWYLNTKQNWEGGGGNVALLLYKRVSFSISNVTLLFEIDVYTRKNKILRIKSHCIA